MISRSLVWLLAFGASSLASEAMAEEPDAGAPQGMSDRDTLTGGWFGLAPALKAHGIAIDATQISEIMGIAQGGSRQGAIYEGRLEMDLDIDLAQSIGLDDTVLHANAYQIRGNGLSGKYLGGNFQTVSSIEATPAARLFDLWIERGFFEDALSVRIGQIAADDEFFTSQNTGGFINAAFGWPSIMAQALPSGGPVYPLATPGIRIRYAFTDSVIFQAAAFNGDPAGGDPGGSTGGVDSQASNPSGLIFPIDHSPFLIAELSYAPGAEAETGPNSVYKVGLWRQGGRYDDLAVDAAGRSLAIPASGRPRAHDGDFGVYAIADMQLYRLAAEQDRALNAFVRLATNPGDRNIISFYADGGLAFTGPFASRPDDVASLGVSFAQISERHARLFQALQQYAGSTSAAPDFEAVIELGYQFSLAPWWTVQPDLQYVFHPTTPTVRPDPTVALHRIGNALVAGIRTSVRF